MSTEQAKEELKDYSVIREEQVPFMLTETEKATRGLRMLEINEEINKLTAEKADKARELAIKIKEKQGALNQLGEEVRVGVMRTAKVEYTYAYKANKVRRVLVSNKELLGERSMNDADRQMLLNLRDKPGKPVKKDETKPEEKKK